MLQKLLGNLMLVVLSLAAVFGIGEIVCRFAVAPPMQVFPKNFVGSEISGQKDFALKESHDTLYQYTTDGGVRLTPNANIRILNHYLSHRNIDIRTNSLGFRSPEPTVPKGKEKRLLVLGDSITLGDYVDESDTYPNRLQDHLQKQDPTIQVFNAGIGSADIHNELQILRESGLKIEPDVILVGLYLNDGELSANLVVAPLPSLFKKSYFANFLNRRLQLLSYRWKHRSDLAGSNQAWLKEFSAGRDLKEGDWKSNRNAFDFLIVKNARDWGAAWDPRTWEILEKHLAEIKAIAQQHGIKLYIALFPARYQVEAEFLYDTPQQSFNALMGKLGLPHLDLLPMLRTAWFENRAQTLYYDKCHLTPIGNDLVGQALAAFVSPGAPSAFSAPGLSPSIRRIPAPLIISGFQRGKPSL